MNIYIDIIIIIIYKKNLKELSNLYIIKQNLSSQKGTLYNQLALHLE